MHVIDATISERFCDILGWAGFETQHQRSETKEERRSLCACAETRCMGGIICTIGGDNSEMQRGVEKTSPHVQSQIQIQSKYRYSPSALSAFHTEAVGNVKRIALHRCRFLQKLLTSLRGLS